MSKRQITDGYDGVVDLTAATSDDRTACQNCGAFVDKDMARVFGDNDGKMYGCPECMERTAVREGGALPDGGER